MSVLNKKQQEAVEYTDGPLLIVAGAGTGKTTVITRKMAYLMQEKNVKPEQILALAFNDKSASEMQDRMDDLLDLGYVELEINTFHGFCQGVLERHGLEIGLPRNFRLMTETDTWLMLRDNIYDLGLNHYRPMGNPSDNIHDLLDHFGKCKDELISPAEYLNFAEDQVLNERGGETDVDMKHETRNRRHIDDVVEIVRLKEIAHAYHVYNQMLLDKQALDFGDLIFYTIKLLRDRPNVLSALQSRFKYILVDEFQDVNYAQYELIRLLAGEQRDPSTVGRDDVPTVQLTVVGDDDQSIYSFRGANVANILRFKEDYSKTKEIVLTENYRSGQEILDASYALVQGNNPDRLEVKLGIEKKLKDSRRKTEDSLVEHIHCGTGEEEVRAVVEKIIALKKEEVMWDDFAILVRANAHADPFIQALEQRGIPYEYLSSSGLHRQGIVIDVFHFLKVLDDYREAVSLYRLLCLPFFGMAENDLQQFTHMAKKKSVSYYEALKRAREFGVSERGAEKCTSLIALIHSGMKRMRYEKPTAVLYGFLEESGYIAYLAKESDAGSHEAIRAIHHIKQFFEFVEKYQTAMAGATVRGFVEYYEHVIASGDRGKLYQPTDTPDSVNIMTIHASKGLEFKYVFIVKCVEEGFPCKRKSDGIALPLALIKEQMPEGDYHYQEERRLFYVAMTRAKEKLFLTSAEMYEGNKRGKKVSRFVAEIGLQTTDNRQQTSDSPRMLKQESVDRSPSTVDYILPKTFSFSQIRSFEVCPYQYKMSYVFKVPLKGSPHFSFGNTMHVTLQRFYERVQELNGSTQESLFDSPKALEKTSNIHVPTVDELLALYESNWISDWYHSEKQRKEYFEKGKHICKTFYASHDGEWTIPVALEKGFRIKLGDHVVTGKIDRVDVSQDGGLQIIDYKTGKAKEKVLGSDKDQLLLYQLVAERLPQYRNIGVIERLTYYYLNENSRVSFLGKEKEIEKLEKKLIDLIDKIHATDFSQITKAEACGRCEYCLLTEFRNT